jgi:ABC-type phosphate/phosphonate transport system substrate-binding protein
VGELRGKSIAMKRDDDIGSLFLNVLLLRERYPEALRFFSEVKTKKNSSQPVLAVFFGQADACITTDISFRTVAELNPQVRERMKVLASSEELLTSVTFFRKAFDRKQKDRIVREAVSMKESYEGRQFMLLATIDGVAQLKEADFDTLRKLLAEYTEMKGKQKGPLKISLQ